MKNLKNYGQGFYFSIDFNNSELWVGLPTIEKLFPELLINKFKVLGAHINRHVEICNVTPETSILVTTEMEAVRLESLHKIFLIYYRELEWYSKIQRVGDLLSYIMEKVENEYMAEESGDFSLKEDLHDFWLVLEYTSEYDEELDFALKRVEPSNKYSFYDSDFNQVFSAVLDYIIYI